MQVIRKRYPINATGLDVIVQDPDVFAGVDVRLYPDRIGDRIAGGIDIRIDVIGVDRQRRCLGVRRRDRLDGAAIGVDAGDDDQRRTLHLGAQQVAAVVHGECRLS